MLECLPGAPKPAKNACQLFGNDYNWIMRVAQEETELVPGSEADTP